VDAFNRLRLRLSASLAALALLTACVHTVHFKVVDADTDQPLRGVSTVWREDSFHLLSGHYFGNGPMQLRASNEDGIVHLRSPRKDIQGGLVFAFPGYRTNYGIYGGGQLHLADKIQRTGPYFYELVPPVKTMTGTNHTFLVRMKK